MEFCLIMSSKALKNTCQNILAKFHSQIDKALETKHFNLIDQFPKIHQINLQLKSSFQKFIMLKALAHHKLTETSNIYANDKVEPLRHMFVWLMSGNPISSSIYSKCAGMTNNYWHLLSCYSYCLTLSLEKLKSV